MKQLIELADLNAAEVAEVLEVAEDFQRFRSRYGILPDLLRGKSLGMIFDAPSLRTRSAFEIAMRELGGIAVHYRGDEARVGNVEQAENVRDFANVLGRFNDVVLSRIYDVRAQRRLAAELPAPFISGMCDQHHPTQALCDLLTIKRRFGTLDGLKIAFLGDATNVAFSLAQGVAYYDSSFVLAAPSELGSVVERFRGLRNFVFESNAERAVAGAHVVLADVWAPMNKKHELKERSTLLGPYRATRELLRHARPEHVFMHNLPASREHEVTPEVIEGPSSIVYEEAVSRLHVARALLYLALRGR